MSSLRALFSGLVLACAATAFAQSASAPIELYQAKPVVTGTGETNRKIGFALAFEDVLVKVSGDPRLIGDPRVADFAKDAGAMVEEFRYRDRLEGIPIHDEQGSHDRPHDLTTIFTPAKIDAVLASLGSRPWTEPRPTITLFLGVRNGDRTFVLSSDGERGIDMRDSLASASVKVAIPTTLPDSAALSSAAITEETLSGVPTAILDKLAKGAGGDYALVGNLVWSDTDLGWIAGWTLVAKGQTYKWQIRGVSFDDAFRNAIRGTAQILSGNGNPD
jgi:uncharacterized protein